MSIRILGDCFRVTKSSLWQGESQPIEQVVPVYYWLEHHHAGQWSWEYEALCRLGKVFRPGASGFDGEFEDVREMYNELCAANGCDHD